MGHYLNKGRKKRQIFAPILTPIFRYPRLRQKGSIFQFPQGMQVCMKWIRILHAPVMISSQKNIMHTDLQSKVKKRHLTPRLLWKKNTMHN